MQLWTEAKASACILLWGLLPLRVRGTAVFKMKGCSKTG